MNNKNNSILDQKAFSVLDLVSCIGKYPFPGLFDEICLFILLQLRTYRTTELAYVCCLPNLKYEIKYRCI